MFDPFLTKMLYSLGARPRKQSKFRIPLSHTTIPYQCQKNQKKPTYQSDTRKCKALPAELKARNHGDPNVLVRHAFGPCNFPGSAQPRTQSSLVGPGSAPVDRPLARSPHARGYPHRRHRQGAPSAHLRPLPRVFGSFGVLCLIH